MHNHDVEIERDCYGYLVTCVQCGNDFDSSRFDAAFCSSTCRSRNHRSKLKLDKDIAKINKIADELIDGLPRNGESKTYLALNQLIVRLEYAVSSVEGELE